VGYVILGRPRRALVAWVLTLAVALPFPLTGIYGIAAVVLLQILALVDIIRAPLGPAPPGWKRALLPVLGLLATTFCGFWAYQAFCFENLKSVAGSMLPTLEIGDRFLVSKLGWKPARRGDVLVFRHPERHDHDMVKRVVGIGGDTIRFHNGQVWLRRRKDQAGFASLRTAARGKLEYCDYDSRGDEWMMERAMVNEERLESGPYRTLGESQPPPAGTSPVMGTARADGKAAANAAGDTFGPVPEGHLFVLGDNRENSMDSRHFGTVPVEFVKGRATRILYSHGGSPEDRCQTGIRWRRALTTIE
jgi:signal peptidase I